MSFFSELKRRNVVRVATAYLVGSWLIIQVAEATFPAFGLSDAALRLVIILLAIALIPTLIFSWVYEITPEGIKREVEIERSESITAHTARKLNVVVIVLLVVAIGMFAMDRFTGAPAPTPLAWLTAPFSWGNPTSWRPGAAKPQSPC